MQTKAHEDRHIAVAKEFTTQTAILLKDYMVTAMKERSVISAPASRVNEVKQTLDQRVADILQQYTGYLHQQHRKVQKTVDTPQERQNIVAACPAWGASAHYMDGIKPAGE